MRRRSDISDDLVLAEAAAWLARLQATDRTPGAEAAFREWLNNHPSHADAFARATDVWEIIPGAARQSCDTPTVRPESGDRRRWMPRPALVAACLFLVIGIGGSAAWLTRDPVYVTERGQQQSITLADGSRVSLNTDSRVAIDYSEGERRVILDRGEAMFEVVKNPKRPFIVVAGQAQVRALGTTFIVRRDEGKLAVVLIEGRVRVSRRPTAADKGAVAVLAPGDRLTIRADAGMAMDRPKIEATTAWRHGEVMFDDQSLINAVGELNRYGPKQIVVDDPALAEMRVSGVFVTGEPGEFAEAMAQIHHLRVDATGDRILLRR